MTNRILLSATLPVVPAPQSIRRHFLSWNEPLLQQAVSFLTSEWNSAGPLDLSDCLVVVPTSQSGRRLREALARYASEKGQAVFSPRVLTPNALLTLSPQLRVASRLESLLAWSEVFRKLALDEFREVFPIDPPARNLTWALRLARDFTRLQRTLGENGLQLAEVCDLAGEGFSETGRWEKIAELDRLYRGKLESGDLISEAEAIRNILDDPILPSGFNRIVVIGTPDPLPVALEILARFAATIRVEIVVFAPVEEAENFDAWGRPVARWWGQRNLNLPDFEQHVHLCGDPAAQVERIVALARDYKNPLGILGVGVADPEALPLLETGFRHEHFRAFNPEGVSRSGDQLYQLIRAIGAFARGDEFSTVETLARCPDLLDYLKKKLGESFSPAKFLSSLDRLRAKHLPPDLTEARRHLPGSREFAVLKDLRALLQQGTFPEKMAAVLTEIFGGRQFDLNRPMDTALAESAAAWTAVMGEITSAARHFDEIESEEWAEISLLLYGEATRVEGKPDGAIELLGWLELLWEDLPHLAVAGLNDGLVPDAVVGDPFLPESLREKLGLKTNAERLARDAYILQTLISSRARQGRLDLFLGKRSAAGDPLRPSRLLLRCADEELPQRTNFLFKEIETTSENPAWQRAWRLRPRRVSPPESTAVTSLRRWLECPFRFYLERVLQMAAVDPAKVEMDALDFGTLCHAALEAMGRSPDWRDCTDAEKLREFLMSELELAAVKRYGSELTLPLVIQLESARQRLSRVAEGQARSRAEGWMIERVEHPMTLEICGLTVKGKIDRIDRHEATGDVRVLDYKTSDRFTWPREAHLSRRNSSNANAPAFARMLVGNDELIWKDLQLPLYRRALAVEFPGRVSCGYFNLPKAVGETGIALWEDFTLELEEAAWRCAQGVAAGIRAGKFWPPNEQIPARSDPFAHFFHHSVAESVIWEEDSR